MVIVVLKSQVVLVFLVSFFFVDSTPDRAAAPSCYSQQLVSRNKFHNFSSLILCILCFRNIGTNEDICIFIPIDNVFMGNWEQNPLFENNALLNIALTILSNYKV